MAKQNIAEKAVQKVKEGGEQGSRRALIEELFQDFHRSRAQVFKLNFIRGIFFGFGSVIGATVVIALVVWLLSITADWPWIGDIAERLRDSLQRGTGGE